MKELEHLNRDLAAVTTRYGPSSKKVASALLKVGTYHQRNNNQEIALGVFRKALVILTSGGGDDQTLPIAKLRNAMGVSVLSMGNFLSSGGCYPNEEAADSSEEDDAKVEKEAVEHLRLAVSIRLKRLGLDHIDTGESYYYLGWAYSNIGSTDLAMECLETALKIRVSILGEEHVLVAEVQHRTGIVFMQRREYDAALDICTKALQVKEGIKGKDDSGSTETLFIIGLIQVRRRDMEPAIRTFRDVLRRNKCIFGPVHLEVAEALDTLAAVYYKLNDYTTALEVLKESLQVKRELLDWADQSVIDTMVFIGRVHFKLGNKKEALDILSRARENHNSSHTNESMDVESDGFDAVDILNAIAVDHMHRGDFTTALELFEESLHTSNYFSGQDHPGNQRALREIGNIRWKFQEYELAAVSYCQAKRTTSVALIAVVAFMGSVVVYGVSSLTSPVEESRSPPGDPPVSSPVDTDEGPVSEPSRPDMTTNDFNEKDTSASPDEATSTGVENPTPSNINYKLLGSIFIGFAIFCFLFAIMQYCIHRRNPNGSQNVHTAAAGGIYNQDAVETGDTTDQIELKAIHSQNTVLTENTKDSSKDVEYLASEGPAKDTTCKNTTMASDST